MRVLWHALLLLAGGENRLWFVDLEVRGACQEIRIDCGPDGETRLVAPFLDGDQRRMRLPVPVRSPLGIEGLATLPLPRAESWPSPEAVRVLGWSARQPSESLRRAVPGALARARPPVSVEDPRAGWAELALVLAAGGFVLALRRRPWLGLGLGLVAGVAAFGLVRRSEGGAPSEPLLDWEAGQPVALAARSARGSLALPREWLEVTPEGTRLVLELQSPEAGFVRADGAWLAGLAAVPAPPLLAPENGWESLAEVWTRGADGRWYGRGPWERGRALGPRLETGTAPPGWAVGTLPPGQSVLLARSRAGGWVRCLGFDLEHGQAGD